MSSAIQIFKKNPTRGEQRTSLINSSDGAGLNLQSTGNIAIANGAAQFGTSDFSLEFILNQEKENTSESYIYVTHTSGHNRLLIFHDVSDDNLVLDFRNASSASTKKDLPYDMNQDFGSPTHYVITFDRSGLATLYKNGNSVATVDISSTSAIDIGTDSSGSRIGTSGTDGVIGTFYRFRTWNKLLSSTEVQTAFERADVSYSSQWGSQTNLVNPAANGDFSGAGNWVGQGNHSASIVSGELQVVASGASNGSSNAATLNATYGGTGTNGKVYTWEFTARASSGTPTLRVRTPFDHSDVTTGSYKDFVLSTSNQTLSITGKRIALENAYFGLLEAGTFFIDNIVATQIGAVVDLDLAAANPTQSRTVQNRAGLPDGEASSSTTVTQVQPIIQGNMRSLAVTQTSQAAGVPADGAIVADNVSVGGATSANASADGDDLVCGSTTGAATGASIVSTTTGNGSIFFTDNAGYKNQGQIKYDHATDAMTVATNTAVALTISSTGAVTVNGPAGTNFGDSTSLGLEVTSAGHQRVKVHSTSTTGHQVGYDLETGNTGPVAHTGRVRLSGGGALSLQNPIDTDRLSIDSSGNCTFNSDDVLITSDTSGKPVLTIRNQFSDASGPELVLERDQSYEDNNDILGTVRFKGYNNSNAKEEYATIYAQSTNVVDGAEDGQMIFRTMKDGTLAPRLTIDSDGLATFSNGIALQTAASNDSATANEAYTLDKYETGTFTASLTVVDGGTAPTSIPTTTGNYTRIGNTVKIQIRFEAVDTSGASGAIEVTGLPFPSANTNLSNYDPLSAIYYGLAYSNTVPVIFRNTSEIIFYNVVNNSAWSQTQLTAGAGKYLFLSGTYTV